MKRDSPDMKVLKREVSAKNDSGNKTVLATETINWLLMSG